MSKGLIKFNEKGISDYNYALDNLYMNMAGYEPVNRNSAMPLVYSVTNECLGRIFNYLDVEDKNVLTVGSSGDQLLHAIAGGAKKITLIDANPMSLPYVELKLATIKNLPFEEFSKYFNKGEILNYEFYSKVSHDLSPQSKEFWDTIMLNLSPNLIHRFMFAMFQHGSVYSSFSSAPYCYDDNLEYFEKVKSRLDSCEIDFIYSELSDFAASIDDQYDCMLLSNISDYVDHNDFMDVVFALSDKLNSGGQMQLHYDFCHSGKGSKLMKDIAHYIKDSKISLMNAFSKGKGIDFGGGLRRIDLSKRDTSPSTTLVTKEFLLRQFTRLSDEQKQRIENLKNATTDYKILPNDAREATEPMWKEF